jgi:hypothetical protein
MLTHRPDWNALYAHAEVQAGCFTTAQAADAGYSPQLLEKYLANGRVIRVRHGVYRVVHFPATEEEDLVVHWLWSRFEGVFSHETALSRHGLSDLLPDNVEMTVPTRWRSRRVRVPRGLRLHYANLSPNDRAWYGSVPITSPARSVKQVPGAVDDEAREGLVSHEHHVDHAPVRAEPGGRWCGPREDRGEPCGFEERVGVARSKLQHVGEAQHHRLAGTGAAGLYEREVSRRHLRPQGQVLLREAAGGAPLPQDPPECGRHGSACL